VGDIVEIAAGVVRRLKREGFEAWIAGGAVRDRLLGRPPHDVDVATSARPDDVTPLFPGAKHVGAAFGVVLVPAEGHTVEVATFRTDGPYHDGRRPSSVTFGTIEDDAHRRDFTVNALYLDPDSDRVLDLVDGRRDLEERVLRAVGDPSARFGEDHLRLLRAVRLAAQLDFRLDPATRSAVEEHAGLVADVATERTRDEIVRILTGPAPGRGLSLLEETGLLRVVLPEVADLAGVEQPPQYHPEGDVLTHTRLLFDHLEAPSPELAMGALLHDVGKAPTIVHAPDRIRFPRHARVGAEMADEIARRLRFSNDSRERIVALVENHMRFMDIRNMKTSTLKRFLRLESFDEHLALHRADCLSSHRNLDNWDFARERLRELGEEQLRPARLVGGRDLMALGWPPGPGLGRELAKLEELQLEGSISTREEALEVARADLPSSQP
jgi:poly(A) polymerase